jgi:hypothetical protein
VVEIRRRRGHGRKEATHTCTGHHWSAELCGCGAGGNLSSVNGGVTLRQGREWWEVCGPGVESEEQE